MWFLDSANVLISLPFAAQWFADNSNGLNNSAMRIVVFSALGESGAINKHVAILASALKYFHIHSKYVVFNVSVKEKGNEVQKPHLLHETWQGIMPDSKTWEAPTEWQAIGLARKLAIESSYPSAHILITGSVHVVALALRLFESKSN